MRGFTEACKQVQDDLSVNIAYAVSKDESKVEDSMHVSVRVCVCFFVYTYLSVNKRLSMCLYILFSISKWKQTNDRVSVYY